jgi:hypothetical protein
MNEDDFDPYELEEIAVAMDKIMDGEENGYEIGMFLTHNDALELLHNYHEGQDGDITALNYCWEEFRKIIEALKAQVLEDEEDDD